MSLLLKRTKRFHGRFDYWSVNEKTVQGGRGVGSRQVSVLSNRVSRRGNGVMTNGNQASNRE